MRYHDFFWISVAFLVLLAFAGCATPHYHPITICTVIGPGTFACMDKAELDIKSKLEPRDEPLQVQPRSAPLPSPQYRPTPREKATGTGTM